MEFKQDDSCSVQKSSCFLEIPFFKLSLTKGTLYLYSSFNLIISAPRLLNTFSKFSYPLSI